MRVIAIHRYFWPDSPPYASFLRQIAGRWAEDGHDVEILAGQPSYSSVGDRRPRRERLEGFTITRLPVLRDRRGGWRQLLNLVAFPLVVAIRILTVRRPDVVMCSTAPQVTLGWAVSVAARIRRADFVYHCMDLHPEIGRISGEFRNPLLYRLLARLERSTIRRASRIVVLSEDMRRAVLARDSSVGDQIVVLNNWALPDFAEPQPSPLGEPEAEVLRVVFTGNLGRFQGLTSVVNALSGLPAEVRIEVVFMGEGKALPDIERVAGSFAGRGGPEVIFLPQGPPSAARALMRTAHLGLVTLVPEVVRYAYPSKTATYAAEGLPLLVLCEQDSELATAVREHGLGWTAAAGDEVALTAALIDAHAALLLNGLAGQRRGVVAYAAENFAQTRTLNRWSEMLTIIDQERTA